MKLITPIIFIATLSSSLISHASQEITFPSMFKNGPVAPTAIKLKNNELASFMLLESTLEVASLASVSDGCQAAEGRYSIELTVDGTINQPKNNVIKISTQGKAEPLILNATIDTPDNFRGQTIHVHQANNSKLKETLISEYSATSTVNRALTLMTMHSHAKASGQNNTLIPYQNLRIKHFYEKQKTENKKQYILGWGLTSLSKANFPINQYWVQFKALKENGQLKRVFLQEDRLVGISFCRIAIDSENTNKITKDTNTQKNLVLKGTMTITKSRDPLSVTTDF